MTTFPLQFKKLRPETGAAGGIKARSASEETRMAIYNPIAALFKLAHPICECCEPIFKRGLGRRNWTGDIHHTRGREGLLLFDIRHWKAICRECHSWIGSHVEEARKLKLICEKGEWNQEP